jgi:predicted RNase H-like HicB family nuclease
MKQIEMNVGKTNTGYSAYAVDFGVATVGETFAELKVNMLEAINMYMEEVGKPAVTLENLKLTFDLPSFFDTYKEINASGVAKRLGMAQSLLAQYVSGAKKPSPKQTERILGAVREVGQELAAMEFVIN